MCYTKTMPAALTIYMRMILPKEDPEDNRQNEGMTKWDKKLLLLTVEKDRVNWKFSVGKYMRGTFKEVYE